MRELNPEDIDKLVSIKGMVIRVSQIIPNIRTAFFRCAVCSHTEEAPIDRGMITQPNVCRHCNNHQTMEMQHNRCLFGDRVLVKVQETPDHTPEGETPHAINLYAYDDLVDVAKPEIESLSLESFTR